MKMFKSYNEIIKYLDEWRKALKEIVIELEIMDKKYNINKED